MPYDSAGDFCPGGAENHQLVWLVSAELFSAKTAGVEEQLVSDRVGDHGKPTETMLTHIALRQDVLSLRNGVIENHLKSRKNTLQVTTLKGDRY